MNPWFDDTPRLPTTTTFAPRRFNATAKEEPPYHFHSSLPMMPRSSFSLDYGRLTKDQKKLMMARVTLGVYRVFQTLTFMDNAERRNLMLHSGAAREAILEAIPWQEEELGFRMQTRERILARYLSHEVRISNHSCEDKPITSLQGVSRQPTHSKVSSSKLF